MNEFWHFWACSWNSDKSSSKFWRKLRSEWKRCEIWIWNWSFGPRLRGRVVSDEVEKVNRRHGPARHPKNLSVNSTRRCEELFFKFDHLQMPMVGFEESFWHNWRSWQLANGRFWRKLLTRLALKSFFQNRPNVRHLSEQLVGFEATFWPDWRSKAFFKTDQTCAN